ncbi:MAG: hypothetical protein AAB567_02720 [Patescibacteria group bacterium]
MAGLERVMLEGVVRSVLASSKADEFIGDPMTVQQIVASLKSMGIACDPQDLSPILSKLVREGGVEVIVDGEGNVSFLSLRFLSGERRIE